MRAPLSILSIAVAVSALAVPPKATFTENKGQWPAKVLYRAQIPGGVMFVERSAFTYVLFSESPLAHHGHAHQPEHAGEGKAHAYRVNFEGGQASGSTGTLQQKHYENYFLGNDPAHWGTGCAVYGEVVLDDVWPGIDLRISGKDGIKYDFIVAPGVDPNLIRMQYEGLDGSTLKDGAVHVRLSNGEVIEEAPIAFTREIKSIMGQGISTGVEYGEQQPTACAYVLDGNTLSFRVPVDPNEQLIIDPVLTFSSYSGSTADNFGFTATYDSGGHLYGGGIAFGVGYPATLGVVQQNFAGGVIDMGITKFSPDGSTLIWSTYIGGVNGSDTPHSMVANSLGELYILGVTGAADFPVTAGCMDASFGVGPAVNFVVWEGYTHSNGADAVIVHLSSDATQLLGSTFLGGSAADGLNISAALEYNYGDPFRGEIALDLQERPIVATSTYSSDIPVSANATQASLGGGQDAYACMLDPGLTTLLWGTYHGGSSDDAGFGIQQALNGSIYITGGAQSNNLPSAGTPLHPAPGGGIEGYVARFTADGNTLTGTTYLGTSAYDQSYFVQVDVAGDVYVVGQTHGAYPVSPGVYANPSGSQFIQKLNPGLSTSLWSTRIGTTGNEDLAPAAFLVSDCGQIYFSCWGGNTNNVGQPNASTTAGLPVTADAYQSTTDGSDFYLMVLEPEAASLAYATFFGGGSSEHVDGGTSRFDKNGSVYQAVCAGCQQLGYPTTPGAWSNTNNSNNCNLGVFKFDLSQAQAIIGINGPNTICINASAQFTNNSVGGTDYLWDFGDTSATSTAAAPSHTFTQAGDFTVTMILTDSSGCVSADTATILITVLPPPIASVDPVAERCPGESAQLQAHGGTTYVWSPSTGLSATNIADPVATPAQETTYSVIVGDQCGTDTATVDVTFFDLDAAAGPDTSTCLGNSVSIEAAGGTDYVWTPSLTLDDGTIAVPLATPDTTTTYTVTITTAEGCIIVDSLVVVVFSDDPQAVLHDTIICAGTSVQLIADDADVYSWHVANGITTLDVQDPIVTPTVPTLYIVDLINACGPLTDSAFVDLIFVQPAAWPDTLVCPGVPVELHATGGEHYLWTPAAGLNSDTLADPIAIPTESTTYTVVVTDANGCSAIAEAHIDLRPWPTVAAGPDVIIDFGMSVQLTATGGGTLTWSPTTWLNDSTSASPTSQPEESITYTVTVTDVDGCKNTDALVIILNGSLFVPNSFTPDGDGFNDLFGALGKDLREVELLVFNRWGELIWSTSQLDGRWDGTYQGVDSPIDTYVWKVKAIELSGRERQAVGHVNLLR